MIPDTIKHGETYDINIEAQDADGVAIVLDDTWQARLRVTREKIGGEVIADVTLAIAAGVATTSLDTGDAEWRAGVYFYDACLTDDEGHDYWTQPVKLTLEARNTPASTPAPAP